MKVNQISTILNSVFQEITGTSAVIQEDLSNIVEVGRVITSSTQWGDNFDKYVGAIIDKVGKTIFVDRVYTSAAPNIMKSSWEYASILEKVRCDVDDYTDNKEWSFTDDVKRISNELNTPMGDENNGLKWAGIIFALLALLLPFLTGVQADIG